MEPKLRDAGGTRLPMVFTVSRDTKTCSMCDARGKGGVRVTVKGLPAFHIICARCVDDMRKVIAQ